MGLDVPEAQPDPVTASLSISDVVGRDIPPPEWNCGETCFSDGGDNVPAEAFDGATPGAEGPTLLYPLANSLHPINIPEISIQWRKGSPAQDMFRVRLSAPGVDYDFYTACHAIDGATPQDCSFTLPESNWLAITVAHRGASASLSVAGLDSASNAVSVSEPIELRFSPQSVTGGLYYWSTAIRGTYRLVFGAKKAEPFIEPRSQENQSECGGCHAVSRDGSTIAFTQDQAAGYLTVLDTATPTPPRVAPEANSTHDSSMLALSPDGSRAVTAFNNGTQPVLQLRDTQSGEVLTTLTPDDLGGLGGAYFPEFSADGTALVVTLSSYPDAEWSVRKGSIAVLPFDPQTDRFGDPEVVVAEDTDFHFYPTWSPDGKWIAFASAPAGGDFISYNQAKARLRLVSSSGGPIYDLNLATQGPDKASTWPKFAPFVQQDGNLMFITFNSKMDYGAKLNNTLLEDQARPQLWMAAIDLSKLDSGDPSWAPVWLPFQETDQNNHLGYWTEVVTCQLGGCGDDQELVCELGEKADTGSCVFVIR